MQVLPKDLDVWLGSKRSLVDFTIRNDMAVSQRGRDVVAVAEKEKTDHYQAMAVGLNASFVPFVVTAFGGLSRKSIDFVRTVRRFGMSRHAFDSGSDVLRMTVRKLAIAIHQHNGNILRQGIAATFGV